jgi:predicted membrane-bound spermidine synthase
MTSKPQIEAGNLGSKRPFDGQVTARRGLRYEAAMTPWEIIDNAATRDGEDLILARTGERWEVHTGWRMLMSTEQHASEEALAKESIKRVPGAKRVLVGGLGLGFTLRAALDLLPPDAEVVVAETSDALVRWNRTHLADVAGRPLEDPRVRLVMGSVGDRIAESEGAYDAILLDVDNGPIALVHTTNESLYSEAGIRAAIRALQPRGIFAVWSAHPNDEFLDRLEACGLQAQEILAPAGGTKGDEHFILMARRPPSN